MGSHSIGLEKAISLVDHERSYLRDERRAFESFRERIRLETVDPPGVTAPSATTERLLTAYREKVMDALDYETVYGDNLHESLATELSPAIARVFSSKEPLTQRHKRKLLVQTTAAIKRRQKFGVGLDDERAALKRFAEELADIDETLQKLPACSTREFNFKKLLVDWEVYNSLMERCEQLLAQRQQQLLDIDRSVSLSNEKYARNRFLYYEMNSDYPVLVAIAAMCERIDSKQNGKQDIEPRERSLE